MSSSIEEATPSRFLFTDAHIPENIQNTPGFYLVCNESLTVAYVGSSGRVRERLHQHRSLLKKGKHENSGVQKLYEDLKGRIFFIVFASSSLEDARMAEQRFLDQPPKGCRLLNVAKDAICSPRGLVVSEETKKKISLSSLGRNKSPETIAKMRDHWSNPESREAIRKKNIGRKHSAEELRKISEGNSKSIEVDGIVYSSMGEAAKAHGVSPPTATYRINSEKYSNWKKI